MFSLVYLSDSFYIDFHFSYKPVTSGCSATSAFFIAPHFIPILVQWNCHCSYNCSQIIYSDFTKREKTILWRSILHYQHLPMSKWNNRDIIFFLASIDQTSSYVNVAKSTSANTFVWCRQLRPSHNTKYIQSQCRPFQFLRFFSLVGPCAMILMITSMYRKQFTFQ